MRKKASLLKSPNYLRYSFFIGILLVEFLLFNIFAYIIQLFFGILALTCWTILISVLFFRQSFKRYHVKENYLIYIKYIGLIILWLIAIYSYLYSSSHFALDPYIDTLFAPNFSIEKFNQVQKTDTQERVIQLLGEPLDTVGNCWLYSDDGKVYPYADFSFYSFRVCFDQNNLVEQTNVTEFAN